MGKQKIKRRNFMSFGSGLDAKEKADKIGIDTHIGSGLVMPASNLDQIDKAAKELNQVLRAK